MPPRRHDAKALYILRDILSGEGGTALLAARYGLSLFSIKRCLCQLRHLGVELALTESQGQHRWCCRNVEEVQASALYHLWLSQEEGLGSRTQAA